MAAKRRSGAGSNNHVIKQASNSSAHRVKLPSVSKGRRPEFYENPAIDQLFAIVTALTGELSVLYDRLDTLERVLVAARAVAPNALDTFVVSSNVADVRTGNRDELLRRVFAVLEAYADRQTAACR